MAMRIGNYAGIGSGYQNSNTGRSDKICDVRSYSKYLMGKYACLTPGKNASVSVTGGMVRKAMSDEKTADWLERELSKAPDYIKEAQRSAAARGSTLKFVSIEFGEEYTTMCTMTVTDGGGTDSDIDKWLERIKEKWQEKKEHEKVSEQKKTEPEKINDGRKLEFYGKDLADLTNQFVMKMSSTIEKGYWRG